MYVIPDFHEWLLGEEADLLPRILLPLAGPEEYEEDEMERLPPDLQYLPDTKQREADPEVRRMLVQAVYKVCNKFLAVFILSCNKVGGRGMCTEIIGYMFPSVWAWSWKYLLNCWTFCNQILWSGAWLLAGLPCQKMGLVFIQKCYCNWLRNN